MADRLLLSVMGVLRVGVSARREIDAVVAPRGFGRHVALGDVAGHGGAVPLRRGAVAAAAARHDPHDLALGDGVLRGFADVAHRAVGGRDLDAVDGAVRAAPEAPRRGRLALEAERDEGGREELVHALDAEAAAQAPGAARVLAKPVAQDAHGADARLHDLHRVIAGRRSPEDDHGRLAVERGPPARAAGIEIPLDEELARLGMRAEGDGRHLVAVRGRGDALRDRRRERAQAEVDEEIDRHVVARGRRRLLRGQHRPGRDGHRQRPEAALVHRVERRGQALDEEPARADRDGVAAVERAGHLGAEPGEVHVHAARRRSQWPSRCARADRG